MDLKARVDVNCERKDRQMNGQTENWTPISHKAKAGGTKKHLLLGDQNFSFNPIALRTAKTP